MRGRLLLTVLVSLLVSACAEPRANYTSGGPSDEAPTRAIRFKLQSTAIAFAQDRPGSVRNNDKFGCELARGDYWTPCFQGVKAIPGIFGYEPPPDEADRRILTARPEHNLWNMTTVSYALASEPAGDDDLLPKQITISSQENLKTLVASAGAGAATGFAFGPIGGAVGAVVGAAIVTIPQMNLQIQPGIHPLTVQQLASPKVSDFICAKYIAAGLLDYDQLPSAKLAPTLGFPFVIRPGSSATFFDPQVSSDKDAQSRCWHPIPNNLERFSTSVSGPTAGMRRPVSGDGWFYRIVSGPMKDAVPYQDWISINKDKYINRFPVSACREITIQILWWPELLKGAQARAVKFPITIADPDYIRDLPLKTGSIVFHQDCGAYVKNTFAPSPEADRVSAITKAISDAHKAQSDWQKARDSSN